MTYHETTAATTDGTTRNDAKKIETTTNGTASTRAMMISGVATESAPAPASASGATPYLFVFWGGRGKRHFGWELGGWRESPRERDLLR